MSVIEESWKDYKRLVLHGKDDHHKEAFYAGVTTLFIAIAGCRTTEHFSKVMDEAKSAVLGFAEYNSKEDNSKEEKHTTILTAHEGNDTIN